MATSQIPKRKQVQDINDEPKNSVLGESVVNSEPEPLDLTSPKAGQDFGPGDLVPIPKREDLETPAAAQQWAENELAKATPRAAQELIAQLRKGDKKERLAAAKEILDRAGVQAKERNTINAPVIVLTAKVVQNLPWAKKQLSKVIEGELVNAKKDGTWAATSQ